MHDLKGTISKTSAPAGAPETDDYTAHGIDFSEPGVFRCLGCGATASTFTVSSAEPEKWRVKGCTCGPDGATGEGAGA